MLSILILVILFLVYIMVFPDHTFVNKIKSFWQFCWLNLRLGFIVLKSAFLVMLLVLKMARDCYRTLAKSRK